MGDDRKVPLDSGQESQELVVACHVLASKLNSYEAAMEQHAAEMKGHVAELDRIAAGSKPEAPKAWWWRVLELPSVTALLTALLTVFVGGWYVTARLQQEASKRDFQQTWMKEVVRGTFDLVGRVISRSEDELLLLCNSDEYAAKDRESFRNAFNDAEIAWRTEKETQALLIGFYSRWDRGTWEAWEQQRTDVDAMLRCVATRAAPSYDRLIDKQQCPNAPPCIEKIAAARKQMRLLGESLASMSAIWRPHS